MNRAQRIIIIVYCIAVAAACFYAPWKVQMRSGQPYLKLGWSLIWLPPEIGKTAVLPKVDIQIVLLEILGITALGGMAFVFAGAFKMKHINKQCYGSK